MGSRTILVTEDDASIRGLVAEALDLEGYEVATANDGAAALEMIEQERPCLLLLDMRMPVVDGWGVASALRARGIRLPIIVITAAQDARRWAREIHADDYLAKPFELNELFTKVARFCPAV